MTETASGQGQMTSQAELHRTEPDKDKAEQLRWVLELQNAEKVFESYNRRVDEIQKRYRDERKEAEASASTDPNRSPERKYNALWSMTETLKPLLFSDMPVPYVNRFHDDSDPPARDAALVLQRCLKTAIAGRENYDVLEEATGDYVLSARGMSWITYAPVFAVRESEVPTYVDNEDEIPEDEYPGDVDGGEGAKGKPRYKAHTDEKGTYYNKKIEYKADEECILSCVSNKDFLHGPATRWRDVPWVARRVPMLREELIERFGKKLGELVPLAMKDVGTNRLQNPNTDDFKGQFARAEVWEIWDKIKRKIIFICPQYVHSILDKKDDVLDLQNFFPCPKPMFGTMTTDSLVPVPDYAEWQDIALELDEVTQRISLLTSALRVAGVYSAEYGVDLKKLLSTRRVNEMIAVQNWAMFAEKGGLKGAVDFFPLDQIIAVLDKLYDVRSRLVAELYEITGISDIVRGASDPRETAAAQKLKGSFANSRLTKRQKLVARHAEEILQIKAEIICSTYSESTIMRMCSADALFKAEDGTFDVARWNAAFHLLRDEPLRMFKIQITNETLAADTLDQAKTEGKEFLDGMASIMSGSVNLLGIAPQMGPVLGKMIMFAIRKFRVGRELEAEFERDVMNALKNIQPPPDKAAAGPSGPTPEEIALKNREVDIKEQELGIRRQELLQNSRQLDIAQGKITGDHGLKGKEVGIKEFKAHADVQIKGQQAQVQAQQAHAQTQIQAQTAAQQHERETTDMHHRHQIDAHGAMLDARSQQHAEQQHDDGLLERHVDREQGRLDAGQQFEHQKRESTLDRAERVDDRESAERLAKDKLRGK